MSDSKYFQTTKKGSFGKPCCPPVLSRSGAVRNIVFRTIPVLGEIHELKEELNHNDAEHRKDAVKKVIAGMTVGKDVSMLFPDVVKCMQVPHLTPTH